MLICRVSYDQSLAIRGTHPGAEEGAGGVFRPFRLRELSAYEHIACDLQCVFQEQAADCQLQNLLQEAPQPDFQFMVERWMAMGVMGAATP